MRILKPPPGAEALGAADLARLAAEMLCLEHGARAVGPDLQLLPAPHAPWPVVTLPPVTTGGAPCGVHWRPTVGVVYYALAGRDRVADLVADLSARLDRAGDAHLRGGRAVAATPSTVLRHRGRIAGGHAIAGPRKCYRKAAARADRADLPARLLLWTPPDDHEPPPHYSIRAAFTWVFMPVIAALEISRAGFDSAAAVNAVVSAVFYDGARISRLADGGGALALAVADFGAVDPPPFLAAPAAGRPLAPPGGAFVVDRGGRLTYVGRALSLTVAEARRVWPPDLLLRRALAAEAWAPPSILMTGGARRAGPEDRDFQCLSCAAPLGGAAVVVRGARAARHGQHGNLMFRAAAAPGKLLAGVAEDGRDADAGVLMCPFCWNSLEAPECLTAHMGGARVTYTVLPFSQAEAAAACPGYEQIATLLAGAAAPLPGAPGAFTVTTPADGPGAGARVILAGEKMGRFPAIAHPAIAAAKLAVVAGVAVAEVVGDGDPPG
jgi:hypothetical protein